MSNQVEELKSEFRRLYHQAPLSVIRAPGRVNLIGEHTDYNEGFVLPMAIDREILIAARARPDPVAHFVALDIQHQEDEFSLDDIDHHPDYRWANYIRGVAFYLKQQGVPLNGLDAVITSTIPSGAGLSSSAALEVGAAMTFQTFGGFTLDKVLIAQLCQRAENDFVGVKSGIMDQFASTLARAGEALRIDCRDLSYELVPLPSDVVIVVADTMKKRHLASSEYNTRRAECENAVILLEQLLGRTIKSLRDVSLKEFREVEDQLPSNQAKRARHVITENERVLQAVSAARKKDVVRFGTLMDESQQSLRDDYEASSPELDLMVQIARRQPGCFGSRLTGAGWGGATVSLVREEQAEDFVANVGREYQERTQIEAWVSIVRAVDGAGLVQ